MSIWFTFPGKMSDTLLQWPVAYQYTKLNKSRASIVLGNSAQADLSPLFKSQPIVECVSIEDFATSEGWGYQPWYYEKMPDAFHMGMRRLPKEPITLYTHKLYPEFIDTIPESILVTEPSLFLEPPPGLKEKRYCVIHGVLAKGRESFWNAYKSAIPLIHSLYDHVIILGSAGEREHALSIDDRLDASWGLGDVRVSAQVVAGSTLVIAASSLISALANALKARCIRYHSHTIASCVWDNVGPEQYSVAHDPDAFYEAIEELGSQGP